MYFHIPIALHHRQYLVFAFERQGVPVQCATIWSIRIPMDPYKSHAAALAPMQPSSMQILPYLDDWLVCAPPWEQAEQDSSGFLLHVTWLGLLSITPCSLG